MRLLINLPPGFFSDPHLADIFQSLRAQHEVRTTSCNTPEEIQPHIEWAEAIFMWAWPTLSDAMLARCPQLKFLGNLDISQAGARAALGRGLPVSVSRRGFSPAVAEMGLTLILAALRRTSTYHHQMWLGQEPWVRAYPDDIDPLERQLSGRRLGLIGFGGIGQRLRELVAPFGCEVSVYDPYLPDAVAAARQVSRLPLADLCARSEILVLCAASNPGSRHLVQAAHIDSLPKHAVFVNICRSALVDNEALLARLGRGDLFAAVDVFDQEPLPADSPWRKLPNAYLTPHRAGGVMESNRRILQYLAEDLAAHLAGKPRSHALVEAMIPSLDG